MCCLLVVSVGRPETPQPWNWRCHKICEPITISRSKKVLSTFAVENAGRRSVIITNCRRIIPLTLFTYVNNRRNNDDCNYLILIDTAPVIMTMRASSRTVASFVYKASMSGIRDGKWLKSLTFFIWIVIYFFVFTLVLSLVLTTRFVHKFVAKTGLALENIFCQNYGLMKISLKYTYQGYYGRKYLLSDWWMNPTLYHKSEDISTIHPALYVFSYTPATSKFFTLVSI